ncbi:MAG: putative porin [Alkalimonas sp.]|nr:putative porin [Alkalimonas sp.]
MMKRTLLASLMSVVSVAAIANNYQHETSLDFSWGDVQTSDLQSWDMLHRYYLTPVESNAIAPLAEAAFIGRNSSVYGLYNRGTIKTDGIKDSFAAWGVGGEYMSDNHNFYVGLDYNSINGSSSKSALSQLGYFLQADWLVTVDVEHLRLDGQGSASQLGFSSKKLMRLPTGDFMSIEARYTDLKRTSRNRFSLGGDYYFGKTLSVGLLYDWTSKNGLSTDTDAFTIRSQWYPMAQLAIRAQVTFDNLETGEDLYTVGASYRF